MHDPSAILETAMVRLLVDRVDFMTARAILGHTVVHALLPPTRRRALVRRVGRHLERCFPGRVHEVPHLVRRFTTHYRLRLAEDLETVSFRSVGRHLEVMRRHVSFQGLEHWQAALARPEGGLLVGCHVGSPILGTAAVLAHAIMESPRTGRTIRVCMDPEATRYARLRQAMTQAWETYQLDARMVLTGREPRAIIQELDEVLEGGGLVTTNLDVMWGGRSRRAFRLFGRVWVRLPALVAAARTALANRAWLLPWVNIRTRRGFILRFEPVIAPMARVPREALESDHPELIELCERLREVLEAWIVAHPTQWSYWDRFHRRLVEEIP